MKYAPLKLLSLIFITSSCAVLHHAQVGDIDDTHGSGQKFDIKVSETGIDLNEAADIAKGLSGNREVQKNIGNAQAIISMFQMGPHTGNGVFSDTYAEGLLDSLHDQCPSGKITNLMAIRETRKYPVISGEIVKITGTCIK